MRPSAAQRIRTYLAARFPLPAVASLAAIAATLQLGLFATLRDEPVVVTVTSWALLCLIFLTALARYRIVDEHRDAAKDAALYPDRPVPSGLVTLRTLTRIGVIVFAVELAAVVGLAALHERPALALAYLPFLAFSALTAVEFFAPAWFARHFTVEFALHQLAYPLMFLWSGLVLGATGSRLAWGLVSIAFVFVAIEIARKFGPRFDAEGVPTRDTYSVVWGRARAAAALCTCLTIGAIAGSMALASSSASQWPGSAWPVSQWPLAVFAVLAWVPMWWRGRASRITAATLTWIVLFAGACLLVASIAGVPA